MLVTEIGKKIYVSSNLVISDNLKFTSWITCVVIVVVNNSFDILLLGRWRFLLPRKVSITVRISSPQQQGNLLRGIHNCSGVARSIVQVR